MSCFYLLQDHKLDILTNSVGLAAALLADWSKWWIDPAGAILLALYTISNWSKTLIENAGTFLSVVCLFAPWHCVRGVFLSCTTINDAECLLSLHTMVLSSRSRTVLTYYC